MEGKIYKKDLLFPELSYKIIGILFQVYNDLGAGHKEKYYQNAIAVGLKSSNLDFKRELPVNLISFSEKVGLYYLDFLIDGKIILEVKQGSHLKKRDIEQIRGYLEAMKLKLGILALFSYEELKYTRIINWKLVTN